MPYFDFIWEWTEDGNMQHISQHGVTPEEVEEVVLDPERTSTSRTSGRPIAFGYTSGGRYLAVIYEQIDESTVYPITAYEVEE